MTRAPPLYSLLQLSERSRFRTMVDQNGAASENGWRSHVIRYGSRTVFVVQSLSHFVTTILREIHTLVYSRNGPEAGISPPAFVRQVFERLRNGEMHRRTAGNHRHQQATSPASFVVKVWDKLKIAINCVVFTAPPCILPLQNIG